jgi:hypothetical protein
MLDRDGLLTGRSDGQHPPEEEVFTAACLLVHLQAASHPRHSA